MGDEPRLTKYIGSEDEGTLRVSWLLPSGEGSTSSEIVLLQAITLDPHRKVLFLTQTGEREKG